MYKKPKNNYIFNTDFVLDTIRKPSIDKVQKYLKETTDNIKIGLEETYQKLKKPIKCTMNLGYNTLILGTKATTFVSACATYYFICENDPQNTVISMAIFSSLFFGQYVLKEEVPTAVNILKKKHKDYKKKPNTIKR